MLDIQPQYLTLSKLLDGRLFIIPDYQRAYSWTSHQRKDLFNDIERVYSKGPNSSHFMAAVVCRRKKKLSIETDEFYQLDIVDGQQRITTLIILLNAIRLALDTRKQTEKNLHRELSELLVKGDGAKLLLLQTNHDTSHHFSDYLRNGNAEDSAAVTTLADRELLEAIEECEEFVESWQESKRRLISLVALLKNRLSFLLHEIKDEKAVYTVFEVLNSRGLEVSWLDRLKSILMGAAFELKQTDRRGLIKELHTIWRDIYSVIGLRQGLSTEALRFAATLLVKDVPSRPLGEQDSVEVFRRHTDTAKQILTVAKWLLDVTRACDKVNSNRRIGAVTRISQARLLATSLYLHKRLKATERDQLLARWEKVSFRIYGMLKYDARSGVGDYVRLAWRVVNEQSSLTDIDEGIREIGVYYPIETAIDSLRGVNFYEGREDELRYFMFRYEEYLAQQQSLNYRNEQWNKIWLQSPAQSIEHIWPQSNAPEDIRHTIGNLLLLPPRLNSTLQDRQPKEKAEAYRKTGLLIAEEVAELLEESRWTKKAVRNREKDLLEWAAREWAD